MRRIVIAALSLLLVLVVVVYAVYAWLHSKESQVVELLWRRGEHLEVQLSALLINCFALGAAIGVAASLLTFGARWSAWRSSIDSLRRDNQRLGAANRALEAALPVLREKYDQAIGGLDPSLNALNQPVGGPAAEAEPLPVAALAAPSAAPTADEPALTDLGDSEPVAAYARDEAARRRPRRF